MKKKQLVTIDPEQVLRDHGFKVTPLRETLLLVLSESSKPLTILALMKKVKRLGADSASVYRAMHAFMEEDIVRELSLTGTSKSYELVQKGHTHHIVCDSCNTIEAIPFCVRSLELNASAKSRLFKRIAGHTLSFSGTCKKCVRAVR